MGSGIEEKVSQDLDLDKIDKDNRLQTQVGDTRRKEEKIEFSLIIQNWRSPDGSWVDRILDLKNHLVYPFIQEL